MNIALGAAALRQVEAAVARLSVIDALAILGFTVGRIVRGVPEHADAASRVAGEAIRAGAESAR